MNLITPTFRHETIDSNPPGSEHDVTLLVDIKGDGKKDILIGGKRGDVTLFWYENPTWQRHDIGSTPNLEAGGAIVDITGNGRPDIVIGEQMGGRNLYWFECPPDPSREWPVHIIENRFMKYHDQAIGEIDGARKIVFLTQKRGLLAYYDIPADPLVSPWPTDCFHLVADDQPNVEGLVIVDIDGDGRNEIVAGTTIFHKDGNRWTPHVFANDYVMTRVAVADIDHDGELEIVLCEGERHPGRLAVCHAPDFAPQVLRDDLFHPHSLEIADFNGNGSPDIFVAEMGLGRNANPRMFLFLNRGDGTFETALFQEGIATHEAKVADLTGNGRPDIVGKPYFPEKHIDVWFNETI